MTRPPLLGEHTADVLGALCGVSTDEVQKLRVRGSGVTVDGFRCVQPLLHGASARCGTVFCHCEFTPAFGPTRPGLKLQSYCHAHQGYVRHSRESGNPAFADHVRSPWVPAFAGMTEKLTAARFLVSERSDAAISIAVAHCDGDCRVALLKKFLDLYAARGLLNVISEISPVGHGWFARGRAACGCAADSRISWVWASGTKLPRISPCASRSASQVASLTFFT